MSADTLALRPPAPFDIALRPPGSKSLSNRALLLAALASGRSTLRGLLDADDTRFMRACLSTLGVTMHEPGCSRLVAVDVDEAVRMASA